MQVTVAAANPAALAADLVVVPLAKLTAPRRRLPKNAAALDRRLGGPLAAVVASGDFTAASRRGAVVHPRDRVRSAGVLLLGIGEEAKLDAEVPAPRPASAVGQAAARKAARVVLVPAAQAAPAAALRRSPRARCSPATASTPTCATKPTLPAA
jgi:hypothetical protein